MWFLLLIVVVYILHQKWNHRYIAKIPGPPSWPFVGNSFQLLGSSEHNWKFIEEQNKRFYPIYKLFFGSLPLIHFLDPNDIEIILSTKNHTKKTKIYDFLHSWIGTGLLTSDGKKWHSRRKLLTPSFHFNIIQQFFKTFLDHSKHLVDRLQVECNKPFTNLTPLISQFTLHTICETAMGTKLNENTKENDEYVTAIYKMGQIIMKRLREPWLFLNFVYHFTQTKKEQNGLIKTLHNFSTSVIEKRKKTFAEINMGIAEETNFQKGKRFAMLDLLLSLKQNGAQINEEGIREEVDTFMFEGHDTISSGILFTLMLLANHLDVQEKVYKEICCVMNGSDRSFTFSNIQQLNYLQLVIKESLRMYPSVPAIGRTLDRDIITSTGYMIPKGTIISIQIYGLHYNPKFYPNPEKFDPDRFLPENSKGRHPYSYIPFSAGPRNCIGQRFAMVEMKTAIALVIRNFVLTPIDKLDDLILITHLTLKSKGDVRIKFLKRCK